jgi:hypothetical protein
MTVIRAGKPLDLDEAAGKKEVEGDIRDFVHRDVSTLRRPIASDPGSELMANNINALLQRVSGSSTKEIEMLIDELENLRDFLVSEGERVQREITGYAALSQAAMQSTRVIADGIAQWKRAEAARHERG